MSDLDIFLIFKFINNNCSLTVAQLRKYISSQVNSLSTEQIGLVVLDVYENIKENNNESIWYKDKAIGEENSKYVNEFMRKLRGADLIE